MTSLIVQSVYGTRLWGLDYQHIQFITLKPQVFCDVVLGKCCGQIRQGKAPSLRQAVLGCIFTGFQRGCFFAVESAGNGSPARKATIEVVSGNADKSEACGTLVLRRGKLALRWFSSFHTAGWLHVCDLAHSNSLVILRADWPSPVMATGEASW